MPAIEVDELARIAERLGHAVRDAGALALSMFGKALKTWTKGPAQSPVCEADMAADDLLRQRLTAIDPAIAWLSEESADDPARLAARRIWIVDPIDGTRAYIAGFPDWAVSAALIEDGRPIAACLFAPATTEFFAARARAGATRNGMPIAATTGTTLEDATIAGPRNVLQRLSAIAPPFTATPRVRSLALRLARVAQGVCDIAIAGGNSHDWDLAAADLLVHEAGGALTSIAGCTLTYNRAVPRHGVLAAAGRSRHATLIELLGRERLALC